MPQATSVFWSRWIKLLCFVLIFYGLALVAAPRTMNQMLIGTVLYAGDAGQRADFAAAGGTNSQFLDVLSGLLGAVTTGWAVQMVWIAGVPFRKGDRWAWYALASGLAVWSVLEFYFKGVEGIRGAGLVAHFGLLIAFAIPLLATRRYFFG